MRTFKLLIVSALLAASLSAPAAEETTIAHEIVAEGYTFPNGITGTLEIKGCTACATQRYQLTATTQYWIGDQQVSLAELRSAFAAKPQALTLLKLENNLRDVDLIFISYYPAPAKR